MHARCTKKSHVNELLITGMRPLSLFNLLFNHHMYKNIWMLVTGNLLVCNNKDPSVALAN